MNTSTETAMSRSKSRVNFMRLFERYALILVWLLLIIGFSIAMPNSFLRWGNFSILFASYAPAALLALAIIIPLTSGDYDLAVGATMTLSSCMIAVLNSWMDISIELSIIFALLGGLAVGLFHALFIVYFRIHSLVVTLGSTSLISGIVQWFTNSSTIGGIDNSLIMWVVGGRLFGVPYAFYYALAAAIVLWFIFDFTPLGRRLLF
ncbi:MAG TPA: ABC transporter permease, partial [Maritimibacter sp.]|nr:ABC transporter permease [Maritimibacter sp.]